MSNMHTIEDFINVMKANLSILDDEKRTKGYIADYIIDNKPLRHALGVLYDENIVSELNSTDEIGFVVSRYAQMMKTDYGITGEQASLAIGIWVNVIRPGNITLDDILSASEKNISSTKKKQKRIFQRISENTKGYLEQGYFYDSIIDLEEYLSNNPDDEKATYEIISLLFDTLYEPQYHFLDGEVEYLSEVCLQYMDRVREGVDGISKFRYYRLQCAKAILLIVLGRLEEAYDLFCESAENIEKVSTDLPAIGDAANILFRIETNIHQIKELAGMDDSSFFDDYKVEIDYYERFVDQILYTYEGKYVLPTLIPLIRSMRNPFYTVVDENGKSKTAFGYGGSFFGMYQASLGYSGKLKLQYWPINLYSGVSKQEYADWTWRVEKQIDRNGLKEHIESNPYTKCNGKLSAAVAYSAKK